MLEEYLIDCCSPTLASLKSASLFNCRYSSRAELKSWIRIWNEAFIPYGLRLCVLREDELRSTALVLVFRVSQLRETLRDPKVQDFLNLFGYAAGDGNLASCLQHLKDRIAQCSSCLCEDCVSAACETDSGMVFPHEIGVFLGYPLEDVRGFIENCGHSCKCVGAWCVYGNEQAARCAFEKFSKCRAVYWQLWSAGKRSVTQLCVAG